MHAGSSAGDEAARSLQKARELRCQAERLEQRAKAFTRGQEGEIAVAQALDGLARDGYMRIDDCRWPGRPKANIDHVLVGPAGLFVIDAKNWSGRVDVRAGVLWQNGRRRSSAAQAAVAAAEAVAALLPQRLPRVQAVLCLCGSAQSPVEALTGGCRIVQAGEIAAWIRKQRAFMTPEAVSAAYDDLCVRLQAASATAVRTVSSRVPDFVPEQWPSGPVRHELPAPPRQRPAIQHGAHRKNRAGRPARQAQRFSRRSAVIGRVLLILLLLDAAGSALLSRSQRVGDVIIFAICTAWLLRLERRRPLMTQQRRQSRQHR